MFILTLIVSNVMTLINVVCLLGCYIHEQQVSLISLTSFCFLLANFKLRHAILRDKNIKCSNKEFFT